MKRLLLAPLLLGFISPVMAKEICTLTSEVEPDVTITLKYTGSAGGIGSLNYKNKPSIGFYVGCLLYTSPSPRDRQKSRMPSSA